MAIVDVNVQNHEYKIHIESGLFDHMQETLKPFAKKRAAIITDDIVSEYHLANIQSQLEQAGMPCEVIIIPYGESSKCNDMLQFIYERLFEIGITRGDCIVALGGGVIGDLVGYAAATFLRGVPLIQIPTTLLAQVDSSVGGKVAINVSQGKNLIGTFYQPSLVLTDIDVLTTLDRRQTLAGWAEVFKYGCIADASILETLREPVEPTDTRMAQLIARCCEIKARYVSEDPYDHGVRMELNFGHTLAHAIEKLAGYGTYLHGEAVAIGMPAAARWGEILGITSSGTAQELKERERAIGLNTQMPDFDFEETMQAIMGDKKTIGTTTNIILLKTIGQATVKPLTKNELRDVVKESWAWLKL